MLIRNHRIHLHTYHCCIIIYYGHDCFIVLISNHNTAFYIWHEYNMHVVLTNVSYHAHDNSHIFGTILMPSIERIIMIIDQYYKNYRDYNTIMQQ